MEPGTFDDRLAEALLGLGPHPGKPEAMKFCPAHPNTKSPCLSTNLHKNEGMTLFCCKGEEECPQEAVIEALLGPRDARSPYMNGRSRETSRSEFKSRPRAREREPYRPKTGCVEYDLGTYLHIRTPTKAMPWVEKATMLYGLPDGVDIESVPLYGASLVPTFDSDQPVFVNEGEKATDACRAAGLQAVGTSTGASTAPDRDVLEVLSGLPVIVVPDAINGIDHMTKVGERLVGIAPDILWYDHEDGVKKGWDMADILYPEKGHAELHAMAGSPSPTPEATAALDRMRTRLRPFKAPADSEPNVVGRTLADISDTPLEPLLFKAIETSGGTIMSAPGGTGKGFTGIYLCGQGVREGMTPLVIDFENRPGEWSRRLSGLGVDRDKVAYLSRPDLPTSHRSRPLMDLVDDIRSNIRHRGADFAIIDSIITACVTSDEKMKSDPQLPWEYMAAIESIGIPTVSFAHPPRGRADGDPFGSIMWVNAARLVWAGSRAEGKDHRVRWRAHKNNERGDIPGFLLAFTYGKDRRLKSATWEDDETATREWVRKTLAKATAPMAVADLADEWHVDDGFSHPEVLGRTKGRIRQTLNRLHKEGLVNRSGPRSGPGAKWSVTSAAKP